MTVRAAAAGILFAWAGTAAAVPEGEDLAARVRAARVSAEDFLVSCQDAQGAWGIVFMPGPGSDPGDKPYYQPDPGVTGFALVALRRSGDPARHARAIERGMAFLASRRQEDGTFAPEEENWVNYKTSMALLALAEIDPKRNMDDIRRAARAVAEGVQTETTSLDDFGGVRYNRANSRVADLNNTVYAAAALRRAEGLGIPADPRVYRAIETFVSRVQNLEGMNDVLDQVGRGIRPEDRGGFPYHVRESKANAEKPFPLPEGGKAYPSYGAMTCAGILAFHYAGVPLQDPRVAAAWEWLERNYTLEANPGYAPKDDPAKGKEGLYYYFHVLARSCRVHGKHAIRAPGGDRPWAPDLARRILSLQREDGSWVNDAGRWFEGEKCLATSLAVAALDDCLAELEEAAR